MKYIAFFAFFISMAFIVLADDFPQRSNTIVTDYTNTLSPSQQQALEQKLVAFNDSTSTQIAVVIMGSVGGYDISDYSVQLFNKWGIGQKGKENGVLLLIAKEDRKAWITTGHGIEGVLPDALCKRVINNDIIPNFKQGLFYEGIDAATSSMISIVKGEYTADKRPEPGVPWFLILIFIVIFFIVIFSRVNSVRRYAHTNNLSFWAAWALMNAALNRGRSGGSWGGFSGGGGGGFGGGGFGGFGGGSSGGGGAGGSW